jgi:hypothetical protein
MDQPRTLIPLATHASLIIQARPILRSRLIKLPDVQQYHKPLVPLLQMLEGVRPGGGDAELGFFEKQFAVVPPD